MQLFYVCLCLVVALASGQRITTIQLDGVQYFVSRMNPYSPELNYFLAYQYCRSLGLQLASFETKEKAESMSQYLQNAGYSKYDFWTSGNRLGTGMFLWMSTGLPFNATFDHFENSKDAVQAGLLDPIDHNSNTSPQRTARDSSSGLEKGCVKLQAPSLRWAPEDCSAVKDFICEQTRCYYYNYGSIPVSSAQGRPIPLTTTTTTTTASPATTVLFTTTPLPVLLSSTHHTPILSKLSADNEHQSPSHISLKALQDIALVTTVTENHVKHEKSDKVEEPSVPLSPNNDINDEEKLSQQHEEHTDAHTEHHSDSTDESIDAEIAEQHDDDAAEQHENENIEETTSVEQRLKKISEEITKYSSSESEPDANRPSFFSLSDLIKTLRPSEKVAPQIDSDYSNTMRVLGERSVVYHGEDVPNKSKDGIELKQANRALY